MSGLSLREHYELGLCIRETAEQLGRRTVIVASGDLSHKLKEDGPYGRSEQGPVYDREIMDVMGNADFGKLFDFKEEFLEKAAECGHRSFVILAGAMDGRKVEARPLSYEGPFGVGYGVCTFTPGERSSARLFGLLHDRKERLMPGQAGRCRVRAGSGGEAGRAGDAGAVETVSANYGRLTAMALDPIEKKPLKWFYPGTRILSVGSYGCNLSCPFCQNHEIAAAGEKEVLFPALEDGRPRAYIRACNL